MRLLSVLYSVSLVLILALLGFEIRYVIRQPSLLHLEIFAITVVIFAIWLIFFPDFFPIKSKSRRRD
jgi:hypothetical protein